MIVEAGQREEVPTGQLQQSMGGEVFKMRRKLLRVRGKVENLVRSAFDLEIEAPITSDAALPHGLSFIVLLCIQAWIAKVSGQTIYLLDECPLNRQGGRGQRFDGTLAEQNFHWASVGLRLALRCALKVLR